VLFFFFSGFTASGGRSFGPFGGGGSAVGGGRFGGGGRCCEDVGSEKGRGLLALLARLKQKKKTRERERERETPGSDQGRTKCKKFDCFSSHN
jgi:hypothetical protein